MAGRLVVAPLRYIGFRRYLIGQLASVACSWVQMVALSFVVVELEPESLGWVVALQFLPSLVCGSWYGLVVDRHDRRWLLICAEAGLGLVALGYAALAAADDLTLTAIYLLASAWGVINALDTPARRALVPMLVPPEQAASLFDWNDDRYGTGRPARLRRRSQRLRLLSTPRRSSWTCSCL